MEKTTKIKQEVDRVFNSFKLNSFTQAELNQFVINSEYNNFDDLKLDWMNNFLTMSGFADYHGISRNFAFNLLTKVCA